MGRDLADRYPDARAVFEAADEALGVALSRVMWEGPEDELTRTHNAQPAILVHTLAVHAVVRDAVEPLGAAGHSLGEYSAYAALGALDLAEAVRLVRRRGELMLEAGTRRAGSMAAILGLDPQQVAVGCREASAGDEVVVAANFNAPGQVVISGDPAAVERAGAILRAAGAKRVLPLNVSGAFHSPLMAPAQEGLRRELDGAALRDPAAPVVANATAEVVRDAETARRLLAEQLTAPVRWVASMERAVELAGDAPFLEIGPGNVLTGLAKRVARDRALVNVGTAGEIERMTGALHA